MKVTLFVLAMMSISPASHAGGVVIPGAPRFMFCSPNGPDGVSFANRSMDALIVADADSDNVIRKNISAKVIREYVEPALKTSCVSSGEGLSFINDALVACQKGCAETIGDWNLRGQARADMLEICRADCRGVQLMLFGLLVGATGPRKP